MAIAERKGALEAVERSLDNYQNLAAAKAAVTIPASQENGSRETPSLPSASQPFTALRGRFRHKII